MKRFVLLLLFFALLTGCTTTKATMHDLTSTNVTLSANNYKILKTGARGESWGFSLFCFIPVVSPSFAEAKTDLYNSVYDEIEGRSIAMAHQTQDRSNTCFFLFSLNKLIVTSDIVEFADPKIMADETAKRLANQRKNQYPNIKGIILKEAKGKILYGEILEMNSEKVVIQTRDGVIRKYPFADIYSFIKVEN